MREGYIIRELCSNLPQAVTRNAMLRLSPRKNPWDLRSFSSHPNSDLHLLAVCICRTTLSTFRTWSLANSRQSYSRLPEPFHGSRASSSFIFYFLFCKTASSLLYSFFFSFFTMAEVNLARRATTCWSAPCQGLGDHLVIDVTPLFQFSFNAFSLYLYAS